MADLPDFTKLVPGFEFLQGLVKNAGAAMPAIPGMSQWIAPTLDPEELEKRIGELKTVQFWLEQNARLLGTTIQAMEVQRMTLSTLQTMNVKMDDLRESMTARVPPAASAFTTGAPAFPPNLPAAFASVFKFPGVADAAAAQAATAADAGATPAPAPAPNPFITPKAPATKAADESMSTAEPQLSAAPDVSSADSGKAPAVDPMKWWGALTEQFAALAANAIKDGTSEAQRTLAGITAATAKATHPSRTGRSATADRKSTPAANKRTDKGSDKNADRSERKAAPVAGRSRAVAESPATAVRGAASGTMGKAGSAAKSARTASPSSRRTTSR